jgi:hypothetical protein
MSRKQWESQNFDGIESPLGYTVRYAKWADRPVWTQYTTWWKETSFNVGFSLDYPFLWYMLLWLPDPNDVSKKNVFVLSGSIGGMGLTYGSGSDIVVDGGLSADVVPPASYVPPSAISSFSGSDGIVDYVSRVTGTFSRDVISELSISADQRVRLSIFCMPSGGVSIVDSKFVGATFECSPSRSVLLYGSFISGGIKNSSIPGHVVIKTKHALFVPIGYSYMLCDSNQNIFAFNLGGILCELVALDTSCSASGIIDLEGAVTSSRLSLSDVSAVNVGGIFTNSVVISYSISSEVDLSGASLYNLPEYSCLFCDNSGQNIFGLYSGDNLFTFLITHVIYSSVALLSLQAELVNAAIKYSSENCVVVSGSVILPRRTFMLSDNNQNTYGFSYNGELYILEEA